MTNLTVQEVELLLPNKVGIWKQCPHCLTGQKVMVWHNNLCLNLSCNKQFDVSVTDADILAVLLKHAQEPKEHKKYWVIKPSKLQKLGNGSTILVGQGGEWI